MAKFKTNVTASMEATINSYNIGCIIEQEIYNLLGNKDRFIEDGFVKERDYRFNDAEVKRKANDSEIEMYEALRKVSQHFKSI